jgi:4-methyl-5(b-hydroxyethyl)-thiazole monophosphate biosynthesis
MDRRVLVPIADGTEELEAVTIIDVLRRAGARVTIASVGALQVTASRGVKIVADCLIADCTEQVYDLIVLPGGMPGAENLRNSKELEAHLKEQRDHGRMYGAICASPAVVLHAHGLLSRKRATWYPTFAGKMPEAGVTTDRVVVDGQVITSQGPGTALEFSLKLVSLLFGEEKAGEVARAMLAD